MKLTMRGVTFGYDAEPILQDVSLAAQPGDVLGILGANGSGKTTLLRLVSGVLPSHRGDIEIDRRRVGSLPSMERARLVAMMEQSTSVPFGLRVDDVVEMGRFPHRYRWERLSETDRAAIRDAIDLCGIQDLRDRFVHTLSGGEYRRVLLAMALAQKTPLLLLDEPFAHLDVSHVVSLVKTIASMDRSTQTLLISAHDVNAILRVASRLVVLSDRTAHTFDRIHDALQSAAFHAAFGSSVSIEHTASGTWVHPNFEGMDSSRRQANPPVSGTINA